MRFRQLRRLGPAPAIFLADRQLQPHSPHPTWEWTAAVRNLGGLATVPTFPFSDFTYFHLRKGSARVAVIGVKHGPLGVVIARK